MGAPFVLMGYVILGWLIGGAKVKWVVATQIFGNVVNIVLDYIFVRRLGMEMRGVAIATLSAQVLTFLLGAACIFSEWHIIKKYIGEISTWYPKNMRSKLKANSDILIRTLCVLIVNNIFIAQSSRMGTSILAANATLIQIQAIMVYLYEGIASTSSIFAGISKGRQDVELLKETHQITLKVVMWLSIGLSLTYGLLRIPIISLFTDLGEVRQNIRYYDGWLLIYPIMAGWGLAAYGLYTGCLHTKPIRRTNVCALVLFLLTYIVLANYLGNHGLWFSFIVFYMGRSILLLASEDSLYAAIKEETADFEH